MGTETVEIFCWNSLYFVWLEIEPWSNSYFSNKLNILVKSLNWSEESIAKMTLLFRNVMKRYGNMRTCELLNIYRPQRSCGKVHVIFSQASVSHSVHRECLPQCMLGYTLLPGRYPLAGTPRPGRYTSLGRYALRAGTPPWQVHPLLEYFLVLNYFWPHRDFRIMQQQMDLYFNCSCHLERFSAE